MPQLSEGCTMISRRISDRARRIGGLALALAVVGGWVKAQGEEPPPSDRLAEGRELFHREWTPNDSRSPRGDGLGPVFNDSSCVACHNSGGPGGGGPSSKNVDIVTAVFHSPTRPDIPEGPAANRPLPFLARAAMGLLGIERPSGSTAPHPAKPRKIDTAKLIEAHPGFRSARSVVLHKSSIDPGYETWRARISGLNAGRSFVSNGPESEINRLRIAAQLEANPMRAQVMVGEFELIQSQRNPTALFGIGLIDAIPDSVLEAAAKVRYPDFPEVAGRVARQKDGRIGRFGWKAQTPTLNDFVLTACAVELGLEVPDHPQSGLPTPSLKTASESACKVELAVDARSTAPVARMTFGLPPLDLTAEQCAALESYVRDFARPIELNRSDKEVESGRKLFSQVGCASCHSPKLGEVEGIYSDLLVHDLGVELGDTGSYTPFVPGSEDPDFIDPPTSDPVASTSTNPATPKLATGPATRQEWRTPPLWGVRDSSPYLHDGRAATLERAIALHGGQGERSAKAFFSLKPRERLQLESFLKSLAAPDSTPSYAGR